MYHVSRKKRQFFQRKRPEVPKKILKLSQAVEGFLLACQARKLSENTMIDYRRTLKKFQRYVGDPDVTAITSEQLNSFLAHQPFSAKTVLNYHIGLSALWTWMIRQGFTEKHIPRIVERPRPQKVAIQPFSETEIRAMLQAIVGRRGEERYRAIIYLLLDTGLRASELCGLTRSDIDLGNLRVRVVWESGKGKKERYIPISQKTASAVFSYLTDVSGRPFGLTRSALTHHLGKIGRRAGVADVHAHRFRHTFAIMYLRNGGDPYTLQEILGHSTMEMVRKYLYIAEVDVENAHRKASPIDNMRL